MRKGLLRLSLLGLALASACADDAAQQGPAAFGGDGSRIYRADSGYLTSRSSVAGDTVVHEFLRGHVDNTDQMKLVGATNVTNGIRHLTYEQEVDGLRVVGAYVKAAVTTKGELVQVIENLAPPGVAYAAGIPHKDALTAAMKELGYEFATPSETAASGNKRSFAKGSEFWREPTVEKVAYQDNGALKQGYLVMTWSTKGNQLDYTLVSGNGSIISIERRTANDSYKVFPVDPAATSQQTVSGGNWVFAGAQSSQNIAGNNVHAYLDTDNNGSADAGDGATTVSDGNFLSTADLASSPSTPVNKNVATQNLFYLNNRMHDILYSHGFDEAHGNFQEDNFGLGGLGSDSVNAEAQDGGGLDNANFSTPADGSNPRMQMYLWSGVSPSAYATVNGTNYGVFGSSFGPAINNTTGPLAVAATDGCTAFPSGTFTGKVAIIDRGVCNFTDKVLNAQSAGAVAVLIANNVAGNAFGPGGTERRVKIPSGMVTQSDGVALKGLAGQSANLHPNTNILRLDGDLDSDIVYHEYCHGLTWRMIGNMSGALAGAIGEGASDVCALVINQDPIVGEYAYADPNGIRRQPYNAYTLTYAAMNSNEVHNDGELYAAINWRLMNQIGFATFFNLWVDGMNYTPAGPHYEDMRNGILQADAQAGGANHCAIWDAYAAAGVGVGSAAKVQGKTIKITESFAKPAECP